MCFTCRHDGQRFFRLWPVVWLPPVLLASHKGPQQQQLLYRF
ncbi:hypothetical protein DDI_3152 [Dickeya dianthicola RNS04.9]|nr:hypothetical protein DDI_3152 [Dickeya dianthicola RNS04.9]